jgi:hypothetical protein
MARAGRAARYAAETSCAFAYATHALHVFIEAEPDVSVKAAYAFYGSACKVALSERGGIDAETALVCFERTAKQVHRVIPALITMHSCTL